MRLRTMRITPLALAAALAGCGAAAAPDAPPVTGLVELETPAAPGSGEPNLAVGPDGTLYLSWLEPAGEDGHALRLARRTAEGWSDPLTVHEGPEFWVNWADFPSVAALPDGTLAAHWLARSGEGTYDYDVRISRSRDGGRSWTPSVVPHRDGTKAEHGFVSLFPGSAGHLGAVWLDGRKYAEAKETGADPEMTLRLTTVGPNGTLGREVLLDDRTCDCCQTAAAATDEGAVVVYRDRSPDEVRDIYVTRVIDGEWTEPRPVHEDGWVIPACPVNGPAISADGRRLAVAWFTAAGDTPRVRLAFSEDAGASFGAPVEVDDGAPVGRVDVELLDDGAALVTWLERVDDHAEIRVRRIGPDGRAGAGHTVATSSAERASGFPRMVRAGGEVVFAWTEAGRPAQVRTMSARLAGS